jgi:hypothetical protein
VETQAVFVDWKTQLPVLPKYKFNVIPIKLSVGFGLETNNLIPKSI